ncbi:DUF1330 domain-containing protein [Hoeflea prorocentri]|uniref:DUF1330 domain-containing protein n=1 Tax=Hoeflea prorocentri TaxID=1922333 RepID=A0A9X3ZHZ3_9HYPH|nr:DUF1330 domain-containing protein [Hoeflea prorocentri]MCY6381869.1 DUF1330 domain-containing protein [Hoeflea prorocentri]MDA5399669.1 DUF1330 domain-containing protein [Hoeflea prorocentri]
MTGNIYTIAFHDEVDGEAALPAYAELVAPAVLAAGARYLCRGEPVAINEARLKARATLLEWHSLEKALALYSDPQYLAALEKLRGMVERDIRIVPSFDAGALFSEKDQTSSIDVATSERSD